MKKFWKSPALRRLLLIIVGYAAGVAAEKNGIPAVIGQEAGRAAVEMVVGGE